MFRRHFLRRTLPQTRFDGPGASLRGFLQYPSGLGSSRFVFRYPRLYLREYFSRSRTQNSAMSPPFLRRGSISSGACADTAPAECNLDEVPKEASPATGRVGKHFDRVLLAVHFRRPPTACVVAFLARWCSTYFAHIVTVGPMAVTDCDSIPHVECQQGSLPSLAGGVMFRCYADVLRRYPGYRGYMLTNDDAVLVPPRLTGFDLEHPWMYKLFGFSKSINLDIPDSRQAVDEKWAHAAHYAELQEWWGNRAPSDLKDRYKVRAGGVSFAPGHAFADSTGHGQPLPRDGQRVAECLARDLAALSHPRVAGERGSCRGSTIFLVPSV